jgi:hypothetical protein
MEMVVKWAEVQSRRVRLHGHQGVVAADTVTLNMAVSRQRSGWEQVARATQNVLQVGSSSMGSDLGPSRRGVRTRAGPGGVSMTR